MKSEKSRCNGMIGTGHNYSCACVSAKIMNMKHSIAKNDKKRKKEIVAEISKMEEELKKRHEEVFLF